MLGTYTPIVTQSVAKKKRLKFSREVPTLKKKNFELFWIELEEYCIGWSVVCGPVDNRVHVKYIKTSHSITQSLSETLPSAKLVLLYRGDMSTSFYYNNIGYSLPCSNNLLSSQ